MEGAMKNIMLVCNAGMSTSMLVQKMKEAAKTLGNEISIGAVAEADLANHAEGVDVLLLGPQIRFKLDEIKKNYEPKGIKVALIDQVDYGRMNGEKVLNMALAL
ncbi:MAG: PTS sugar transporter subunit IIB [Spirochaetaceae bacterium]|jgi:PTS system cellobiose-specific IIB component|nr:PTS sugar transporter subunit IIB [Spirochaetaceae bacterium]